MALKQLIALLMPYFIGFIGVLLLIIIMIMPILMVAGVIHEVTDWIVDGVNAIGEFIGDSAEAIGEFFSSGGDISITITPDQIPEDYDLSENNPEYTSATPNGQAIANAAVDIVRLGRPYLWGSHPSGPYPDGIPAEGLDCAGFVQASIWTGTGQSPGYLTTQTISDSIGTKFMQIDCSDLQAGDIGLKRRGGSDGNNNNHTGVYLGKGLWAHAAGAKTGMVISQYKNFTICLRYNG